MPQRSVVGNSLKVVVAYTALGPRGFASSVTGFTGELLIASLQYGPFGFLWKFAKIQKEATKI